MTAGETVWTLCRHTEPRPSIKPAEAILNVDSGQYFKRWLTDQLNKLRRPLSVGVEHVLFIWGRNIRRMDKCDTLWGDKG